MMEMTDKKELNSEKIQFISNGIRKQNLMKMYNATAGKIAEGYVEVEIPRQEALIRGAGFFYGVVVAAAVDTAAYFSAATLYESDAYFVTVELKVNYLNPAYGEILHTMGEVIKSGKTLVICKCECYVINDGEKSHVATSLVTLMKVKQK